MEDIELIRSVSDVINRFIKGSTRPLNEDEEKNLKKIIKITKSIIGEKYDISLALFLYKLILVIYSQERFYELKDKNLSERERKEIIKIINIQYKFKLLKMVTPRQFQAIKEEYKNLKYRRDKNSQARIKFLLILLNKFSNTNQKTEIKEIN